MASATISTFCCALSDMHPSVKEQLRLDPKSYNVVCIIAASCGVIGAIFQLMPYPLPDIWRSVTFSTSRHRRIIQWLAFADLCASVGILVRSSTWLANLNIDGTPDAKQLDEGRPFCAFITGWITYFYEATYMWTLCYALDVYLTINQKQRNSWIYHCISWGIPLMLTLGGLSVLYVPDFHCHGSYIRVLVNYILSYLPIITVMVVNPIFYYLATKQAKYLLMSRHAQYTSTERYAISVLKERAFKIVLVFYICWAPNILNGILLWSMWYSLPRELLLTLWYYMAVVNPLQAVLNLMVYRNWTTCWTLWTLIKAFYQLCRVRVITGSENNTPEREHPEPEMSHHVVEDQPLLNGFRVEHEG